MGTRAKRKVDEYRITVRPLSKDGEALRDCLKAIGELGRRIPKPGVEAAQWRQRLPRTLYARLTDQAKRGGVSINSLMTAMIAEAMGAKGRRQTRAS